MNLRHSWYVLCVLESWCSYLKVGAGGGETEEGIVDGESVHLHVVVGLPAGGTQEVARHLDGGQAGAAEGVAAGKHQRLPSTCLVHLGAHGARHCLPHALHPL